MVIIIHFRFKVVLLLHSRGFNDHSVSARKKGGFDKISCPTTDMELFETVVSISAKLAMKLAYELSRSHGVSLATVEFPVGALLIQSASADYAMNAGNGAVWSCRMPVFSRCLLTVSARSCLSAFPT